MHMYCVIMSLPRSSIVLMHFSTNLYPTGLILPANNNKIIKREMKILHLLSSALKDE